MNYCLYHKNCLDGFGAAYAVWKQYGDNNMTYIPVAYGQPLPELKEPDKVFIVDFSYSRETLDQLNQICALIVLDHHNTAEKELEGASYAVFDMNRSGAILTWSFLFPGKKPPELLEYVQDRDLWRHEMPHTKEINIALRQEPQQFKHWDDIIEGWDNWCLDLIVIGEGLLQFQADLLNQLAKEASVHQNDLGKFAFVNCFGAFASDLGNKLVQEDKSLDFAVIWEQKKDHIKVSLRSRQGEYDVSALANRYGGGGHKAAAGFTCESLLTPSKLFETL